MSNSNETLNALSKAETTEFDLHGIIGIRLIDPKERDLEYIVMQLGLSPITLTRAPDICIRFEENLSASNLTVLGLNYSAFNDDGFYLLDQQTGSLHARIAFETIGEQCEIVCQSGLGFVPLLFEIINLSFMRKDYVALHASAFQFNGKSILVMGWEKGGKTESLLSFANNGGKYIGDEMIVLSSDGERMFGIPIPLAVWHWQFKYIADLLPKIGVRKRLIFAAIFSLDKVHSLLGKIGLQQLFPFEFLGKSLPALRKKLKIWATPQELFKDRLGPQGTAPDKVFLLMSHDKQEFSIEPCDPMEISRRMTSSNAYERVRFFEYYQAFKFAFPELTNKFLERIDEAQRTLINNALAGKNTCKVMHPYPVPLDKLFTEMSPYCDPGP